MHDATPAAAIRLVQAAVDCGAIPGAVLAVGRGAAGPVDVHAFGRTMLGARGRPVTENTVFDLASLTKVVATTPCLLKIAAAGELDLDDPVARYLPAFAEGGKARVTLRQLLAHTSGMPAHRFLNDAAEAEAEPLEAEPGTRVCYSDLGFIVLGRVIERVSGTGLAQAARALVFDPLGLADTGYLPERPAEDFAATEPRPETGEPKVGVVHDENAEALGGVAGHAGLFGTAADLARYLRSAWIDPDGAFLTERSRREATRCWTDGLDGRRGLGWTLAGDRSDHTTAAWPDSRAGHTGYTGTSLAFDPASGLWTVLLTNAVHLGRDPYPKSLLRRTVHAAVAGWADAARADGGCRPVETDRE